MTDQNEKEDPLVYSELVKQQMADDLAEAMKEIGALMRQAHHAWRQGQYASFYDALRALGFEPEEVGR